MNMPYKDPEALRAYRKKRRAIDRERDRARYANDPAFRERKKASARKYDQEHREKANARKKKWHAAHLDARREAVRRYMRRFRARFYFDANAYAAYRAYNRTLRARKTVLTRGFYRPRFSFRIPDWATKCMSILDNGSQYLVENITPSQRAYARELAIERKNQRERA